MFETVKIVRPDDFAFQRTRRLEILESDAFKIVARRQPLDTIRIALIGALKVPKPMLASVGENDERRLQIFGVTTSLFFRVVGVEIFALRFENAQSASEPVLQKVVGSPCATVQFKLDLLWIEQIPPAEFERLVDQDTGFETQLAGEVK